MVDIFIFTAVFYYYPLDGIPAPQSCLAGLASLCGSYWNARQSIEVPDTSKIPIIKILNMSSPILPLILCPIANPKVTGRVATTEKIIIL